MSDSEMKPKWRITTSLRMASMVWGDIWEPHEPNRVLNFVDAESYDALADRLAAAEKDAERLQGLLDMRPPYYCPRCYCGRCGNTFEATHLARVLAAIDFAPNSAGDG